MTVTTVYVIVQKQGNEPSATRLTMSDRDAGIVAGALSRCPGLIPGEISSILGGAFSQLQAVVAQNEPVGAVSIPDAPTAEQRKADMGDSDQRTVNADRVSQPPPAGVNPVPGRQQAEDPMAEVRRVSEGKPADATDATQPANLNPAPDKSVDVLETPAGKPMDEPVAETKSSDKRKR